MVLRGVRTSHKPPRMPTPLASRAVCVWNRNIFLNDYSRGFARCEAFMDPLSASDVFLTVAIMSATFLAEVEIFILIGTL